MRSSPRVLAPALVAAWSLAAATAAASPVAIANAGFEDPYPGSNLPAQYGDDVPTGAFPTGPAPAGWTAWYASGSPEVSLFVGVLNPGTSADHAPDPACFPSGAPEGENVVLLYADGDAGGAEYGVEQTLAESVAADTRYTLTVEVGNIASCAGLVVPYTSFFDLDGFPGYRVQLLAGGVVVAEDAGPLPIGEGEFASTEVEWVTGGAPAELGQPLAVRLVNRHQADVPGVSGLEVDFDDVRLDAAPVAPVPVGPWVGGLTGGMLAAAGVRRIRRRG